MPATPTTAPAASPTTAETPAAPLAPSDAARDVTMPETPQPAASTPSTLVNAAKLPRDLSPWSMFMQADLVVKSVMVGLILASVITWTVWLAKSIELAAARRRVRKALAKLNVANSIGEAASLVDTQRGAVPAMLRAAIAETRASWDVADKYAIKERVAARVQRVELAAGRDINRGTGSLATIGSTAPFVG
jgi:biopolymer transport protein ExbB